MANKRALVLGCFGLIGSHMSQYLANKGYTVIGSDIKDGPEFWNDWDSFGLYDFVQVDLRETKSVLEVASMGPFIEIYDLAANMGGMGHLSHFHADIVHDNALINLNVLEAFKDQVVNFFFSSSACAYPESKQWDLNAAPLREEDAYPAWPDMIYGWEKILTEKACTAYSTDYDIRTHIARFHNCYGSHSEWMGGREKAPSALCRKVAGAKLNGVHEIEVWGDGKAQRTFMHVSDCVDGIYRLTTSDHPGPMNLGSTEQVTVDELAYLIADIAQWEIEIKHVPGPQGVRSRNSDNSLAERVLGWTPKVSLRAGLELTYPWIEEQVRKARA